MKTSAYLGPRNGKNTHVDQYREGCFVTGYAAERIGFVSFSKKATEEARTCASRVSTGLQKDGALQNATLVSFSTARLAIEVMRSFDYQRSERARLAVLLHTIHEHQ